MRRGVRCITSLFLLLALLASASFRSDSAHVTEITLDEAQPVLGAMQQHLPSELKGQSATQLAALWPEWVRKKLSETRDRLASGEEDSLANLLLFGTSYTRQPRLTPERLSALRQNTETQKTILQGRILDLLAGLTRPGQNERLQFMRHFLEAKGYGFESDAERQRVAQYLVDNLRRVLRDAVTYKEELAAAHTLQDANEEFARRSTLFENRGISLDTSLMPNFAVEEALRQIAAERLLKPGSVRRIGVIGPGLDFIDKSSGYDFYPQQTIQPFAVIDAMLRLGLSNAETLRVTTFDISSRVNEHLAASIRRANSGRSYLIQLPLDTEKNWTPKAVAYWQRFGRLIGDGATPLRPASADERLRMRAIRIRPEVVRIIEPADLNVVYQRPELSERERFDLLLATNVFIYYGVFQQSLAMANMAQMLRPGGLLLTNDNLPEVPGIPLHSAGALTTPYSDMPGDGDRIVWYQLANQ